MEGYDVPKSTGMKRTGSGSEISKSNVTSIKVAKKHQATALVGLCLKSDVNIDLDLGKLYRILPDTKARATGYLRVIDESGEDYLYPAAYFRTIRLPAAVAKKIVVDA